MLGQHLLFSFVGRSSDDNPAVARIRKSLSLRRSQKIRPGFVDSTLDMTVHARLHRLRERLNAVARSARRIAPGFGDVEIHQANILRDLQGQLLGLHVIAQQEREGSSEYRRLVADSNGMIITMTDWESHPMHLRDGLDFRRESRG